MCVESERRLSQHGPAGWESQHASHDDLLLLHLLLFCSVTLDYMAPSRLEQPCLNSEVKEFAEVVCFTFSGRFSDFSEVVGLFRLLLRLLTPALKAFCQIMNDKM